MLPHIHPFVCTLVVPNSNSRLNRLRLFNVSSFDNAEHKLKHEFQIANVSPETASAFPREFSKVIWRAGHWSLAYCSRRPDHIGALFRFVPHKEPFIACTDVCVSNLCILKSTKKTHLVAMDGHKRTVIPLNIIQVAFCCLF